jgi:hypothetical protein
MNLIKKSPNYFMKEWIKARPWIWIVLWFFCIFLLWAWFIPYSKTIGMTPAPLESEKSHE